MLCHFGIGLYLGLKIKSPIYNSCPIGIDVLKVCLIISQLCKKQKYDVTIFNLAKVLDFNSGLQSKQKSVCSLKFKGLYSQLIVNQKEVTDAY